MSLHGDGRAAGLSGQPVSDCPWKPSTAEGKEWLAGWTDGAQRHRAVNGQFGATIEEKAAAGLAPSPSRQGRGQWDQVHELWGGQVEGVAIRGYKAKQLKLTAPVTGNYDLSLKRVNFTMTLQFEPEQWEQIKRLFEQVADHVVATARAFQPFVDAYMADQLPTDPKARALARKRKPFTCHRHGVQPGGFCRTCQRRR